jgi:tripartite-type tricarboxylate transporter receptor subunit TctC
VPTLRELGYEIVYEVVRGLVAPKTTPEPIRTKLGDACARATAEAHFAAAMRKQATRVAYLNAKDYAAFLDKLDADSKAILTELGLAKK